MTVQADRRTAEKLAKWLRAHGYVLSAQMLEHYLSGVGGTVCVPLASLQSSFFFQDAEKRLLSRVNEAVLRQAVAMLREGDDQRMVDHIDDPGDFLNDRSAVIEPFTPYDAPDLYGAIGQTHIRAYPQILVTRAGERFQASGSTALEFHDTYDFDSQKSTWFDRLGIEFEPRDIPSIALGHMIDENALALPKLQALAAEGGAAKFDTEARWIRDIVAKPDFTDLAQMIKDVTARAVRLRMTEGLRVRLDPDDMFEWGEPWGETETGW